MEAVHTVRTINQKWLVQGRLDLAATAYLDHLETTDTDRLHLSCTLALEVLKVASGHKRFYDLDRKACFYPALFYYATSSEIQKYLKPHKFTQSILFELKSKRTKPPHNSNNLLKKTTPKTQIKAKQVATLLRSSVRKLNNTKRNA